MTALRTAINHGGETEARWDLSALSAVERVGGWSNTFLVQVWRNAPLEITTWGKIWRTVLFLGFWVVLIYFIGWWILLGGGDGFDDY